jgi:hypothetical protein
MMEQHEEHRDPAEAVKHWYVPARNSGSLSGGASGIVPDRRVG